MSNFIKQKVSDSKAKLLNVAEYYNSKIQSHGTCARGVDWNGEESQALRFQQLSKVFMNQGPFSISDLGCGYGAYYSFLKKQGLSCNYKGFDISDDMLLAARELHKSDKNCSFHLGDQIREVTDYTVASGIFNVSLQANTEQWRSHIFATISHMDTMSSIGFAFNCLTSYSDLDRMASHLYYADPLVIFDFCKRHYSKEVALLHDYGLYEFTIIVRKKI